MANILIVDDSSIARRNLSTILTNAGHNVVAEVSNGESAYREYEKYTPDIVTMDITMPILDGIDALKKILKYYPDANIIMVSALDQKNMVLSAIQYGARHYIIKPFTAEKVTTIVDEVLSYSDNAFRQAAALNSKLDKTIGDLSGTINELDHTITTLSDEPVKSSSSIPFTIASSDKLLNITLYRGIQADNFTAISMIVQGFLYSSAISVELNLEEIEQLDEAVINKLVELARAVTGNGSNIKMKTRDKKTEEYVRNRNGYLGSLFG